MFFSHSTDGQNLLYEAYVWHDIFIIHQGGAMACIFGFFIGILSHIWPGIYFRRSCVAASIDDCFFYYIYYFFLLSCRFEQTTENSYDNHIERYAEIRNKKRMI